MNIDNILILTTIGLFLSYVIILTIVGGFKTDITHLIYTIEDTFGRKWMRITTAVYLVCASCLAYVAINAQTHWLLLISAISFAVVGILPDVRKKQPIPTIHVVFAMSCILFGVLSSIIELHSWYLGCAFLLFLFALKKKVISIKHGTYWVELSAFLVITLSALNHERHIQKESKN